MKAALAVLGSLVAMGVVLVAGLAAYVMLVRRPAGPVSAVAPTASAPAPTALPQGSVRGTGTLKVTGPISQSFNNVAVVCAQTPGGLTVSGPVQFFGDAYLLAIAVPVANPAGTYALPPARLTIVPQARPDQGVAPPQRGTVSIEPDHRSGAFDADLTLDGYRVHGSGSWRC